MSRSHDRHEGVSCDGCHTENFRCPRYKCLVCFDYDLCARCFDAGAATQRHSPDHPMQCILTRADHELYYGGESLPNDQPQSFACPFCRNLGFTEITLQEHVATEHNDVGGEVVCPVCAATPSGEPNHMTDDLANHLTVDHLRRNEFSQEEVRLQRRMPPAAVVRGGGAGGAIGTMPSRGGRGRGHAAAAAAGLSAFARESVDPIAELLSQLGGIRRAGASAVSQIQQLQQQVNRQAPRRTVITTIEAGGGGGTGLTPSVATGLSTEPSTFVTSGNVTSVAATDDLSRLQLPTLFERNPSDEEKVALDVERANRSLFLQELLLSTFMRPVPQTSAESVGVKSASFNNDVSAGGSFLDSKPLKTPPVPMESNGVADFSRANGNSVDMDGPAHLRRDQAVASASVNSDFHTAPAQVNQNAFHNSVRVATTLQRHQQQQLPSAPSQAQSRAGDTSNAP